MPHYAPGGGSPFAGRYDGGRRLARRHRQDGLHPSAARCSRRRPSIATSRTCWDLLAPLGGLPLLSPLVAASALPELALNLLSGTRTQSSIHFHYTAGAIPGLVAGAVLGAARVQRAVAARVARRSAAASSC